MEGIAKPFDAGIAVRNLHELAQTSVHSPASLQRAFRIASSTKPTTRRIPPWS